MANKKKQKPDVFLKYVADTLKARLRQLGVTRYRVWKDNSDIISAPSLEKLVYERQMVNAKTLYQLFDRLGMDIAFRLKNETPKEDRLSIEQTTALYEKGFDTEGILYPTVGDLMRWLPKSITYEQELFAAYDSVEEEWVVGYRETDICFMRYELINAMYELLLWAIDNEFVQFKSNQDNENNSKSQDVQ